MKKLRCSMMLILLAVIGMGVQASEIVEKHAHVSYDTNEHTHLLVNNKFGSVSVVNTTEDKMTIDVNVKVEAASLSKAERVLNEIHIALSESNNQISAITEIEEVGRTSRIKIDIDYVVRMPKYVDTDIRMKYGDVTIDVISGRLGVEVKYGSMVANDITCSTDGYVNRLDLSYSNNCHVVDFGSVELDMSYSDIDMGTGNGLLFDLRYSDMDVDNVALVKGDIAYGDLDINTVLDAKIESKYTDVEIDMVRNSLDVEIKYGDLEVDRVNESFSLVRVVAAYSDVELEMSARASYAFEAEVSYGDIDLPSITMEYRDKDGSDIEMRGYKNDKSLGGEVYLDLRYGDLSMDEY